MKIVCEACSAKYSIADDKVRGKVFKIRCKKCSHIIVVRGDEGGERQAAASGVPAEAPAVDSAGAQWYVVIDGEQVGPLTSADVGARVAAGQIGPESYAWMEGMADWAQVANIPELAGALRSRPQRAPTPAAPAPADEDNPFAPQPTVAMPAGHVEDMFGRPAAAAARAPAADLFAAQQTEAADDAFNAAPTAIAQPGFAARGFAAAATAAAPSPLAARGGGGGLFSASTAAAEPALAAAPAAAPGGAMTGQRSENSVLFSLSNLEALAAPKPAAAPLGGGSFASAGPSEGSGLIDIRAMAQLSVGKPSGGDLGLGLGGGGPSPLMSDLPSFAATPLSPVVAPLLPGAAASSGGMPKWVIGLIVVCVLAVGGMVFAVYKTMSQPTVVVAPPPELPALPPPGAAAVPAAAAPVAPPVATAPAAEAPAATPPVAAPPTVADTAAAAKKPASSSAQSGKKPAPAASGKPTASAPASAPAAPAAPAPAAAAPAKKPDAKSDSLDDLLAGALGGKKPASSGGGSSAPAAAPEQKLGPLQKSDIVKVMTSIMPKTKECYDKYKVPGIVNVNIKVEGSGKVSQADVTGKFAGTPSGECIEAAIKGAKFPASDGGMTFPYPIPLR